jgi:peroxiredoxin
VPINSEAQTLGAPAPDFTLNSLSGGNFKLSDHRGKVVLIFFLGNTCPFCIAAAPTIQSELINTFSSNPNFIAIGIDTWDGSSTLVNSFKQKTGLAVNYLLMGSAVASSYQSTYDRLMVVDKSGILEHKGVNQAITDVPVTKTLIQNLLEEITTALPGELEVTEDQLLQNFPNPVNDATAIYFVLKKKSAVRLSFFDPRGQKIRELANAEFPEGLHTLELKRGNLPPGTYFYQMTSDSFSQTRKMIVQ